MAGGDVGGQDPAAQTDRLTILQGHGGLHRLVATVGDAVREGVATARGDHRAVGFAGVEPGACRPLDRGEPPGVVDVPVGVEEDLDLIRVQTQGADIGDHLPAGRRVAPVDDDQTRLGDDQVGRVVRGAHVVEPLADPEGRIGQIAGRALLSRGRKPESGGR
jgi:hypothetical protein